MRIPEDRIKHMHGVAEYMSAHAEEHGLDPDRMYVLGLLHDVGYINGKKGHESWGADLLRSLGYNDAWLISWHGTDPELYLALRNMTPPKELALLWEADFHIDSEGNEVSLDERLKSIGEHNGFDSISYRDSQTIVNWLKRQEHFRS